MKCPNCGAITDFPEARELAKSIAQWVTLHGARESVWLSPVQCFIVDAEGLLDHIVYVTGISKEEVGIWVDEIADQMDRERRA